MKAVPIRKAKNSLSRLVRRATKGETFYIGNHGKPGAVLTSAQSIEPSKRERKKIIGILSGKLTVPDDFDAPLPDELLAFFGESSNTVIKD